MHDREFRPGDPVDVMSGVGNWYPGTVVQVTGVQYVVDLRAPVLAQVWSGMDRWQPGTTVSRVSVWKQAANLPGRGCHIRPR